MGATFRVRVEQEFQRTVFENRETYTVLNEDSGGPVHFRERDRATDSRERWDGPTFSISVESAGRKARRPRVFLASPFGEALGAIPRRV